MNAPTKQMLRMELLTRRRDLTDDVRTTLDSQLTAVICAFVLGALSQQNPGQHAETSGGTDTAAPNSFVVAAYVPQETEPGLATLPQQLKSLGARVILPVVRAPGALDWVEYQDEASLAEGRFGLLEPVGPSLGQNALATADLIVTPGLAGDLSGMRMGRGGGFYDQSLPLARETSPRLLCLYPWEIIDQVPAEVHDIAVSHIATPTWIHTIRQQ